MNLEILKRRHSVRSYELREIDKKIVDRLKSEATFINTHEAGLRLELFFNDPGPFMKFTKSYGIFRNVRNYMAVIIDPSFTFAEERAGYFAEKMVIEMTELGLGSCFIGGTFSRDDIGSNLKVFERLPFIVAFGYPDVKNTSFMGKVTSILAHSKHERTLESFWNGTHQSMTKLKEEGVDVQAALEAVSVAPSALNRRPVRLSGEIIDSQWYLTADVEDYSQNAVELGIAKYNITKAIGGEWDWGNKMPFYPDDLTKD